MKVKVLFGICGIIVVAAGAAYLVFKFLNKTEKAEDELKESKDEEPKETAINIPKEDTQEDVIDLGSVKKDVAQSVSERHEEAKIIMEDAVKTIMSKETPESTKNDEIKKQLFEDINKL